MAETTDQQAADGAGGSTTGGGGGPAIPPQLQARVREGIELLRPHPHRGDLIAAGAVPLTVALLLINLRLEASWGDGVFFVLNALAAGLVLGMGVLAPREEERPRAYQVVLQLCGLVLLFVALVRLGHVLGSDQPLSSGTAVISFGAVAVTAAWLARERESAICTLVAGVAGTFALVALIEWVFSPSGPTTARWVLLIAALGLLAGALVLRDRHRRESVYLVDAAGVAILALGLTFVNTLIFGLFLSAAFGDGRADFAGPGVLWKVVLLAAGLGLVAYAGVDREAGPGYLGALILLVFVLIVGIPGDGGPNLWFWPLVLLLVGGAMIAAGLRPRRPLPPEPARGDPAAVVPGPVAPVPAPPAAAAVAVPVAAPEPAAPEPAAPPAPAVSPAPDDAVEAEPPASEFIEQKPEAGEPAAAAPEPEPAAPVDLDPPTRPQPPVYPPEPPAPEAPPAPPEPPEPPARGSLWARPDPGEQPTRPHRLPRPPPDEQR